MIISSGWYSISAAAALLAFSASAAPSMTRGGRPPLPPSALIDSVRGPAMGEDRDFTDPSGLQYRLVPPVIEPGERTTLEIELPVNLLEAAGWNEESGPPAVNDDLLTQAKSFQILDTTYRRTKTSLVWGYDITSHRTGSVTVPPLEIKVGSLTLSSEAMELRIVTSRPEGDTKIREEFGPLDYPSRWWYWLLWLSWLPAAYYLRQWLERKLPGWIRRFKPVPPPLPPAPQEDPLVWLRRELERLRAELVNGAHEGFADELSSVLREYFVRKLAQPARSWTTREISLRLSSEPTAAGFLPVFRSCDEVKFARKKSDLADRFNKALEQTEKTILACGT
jgi:hypothetical protein